MHSLSHIITIKISCFTYEDLLISLILISSTDSDANP